MSEALYVAVDNGWHQHDPEGVVAWGPPDRNGAFPAVHRPHLLELRTPSALLDVLDELVCRAEPLEAAAAPHDGVARVARARLVAVTAWNTESAARFAIDCAAHVSGPIADLGLPDGSTFASVLDEARRTIAELTDAHAAHLGYLWRVGTLHRLKKDRAEISDLSAAVVGEDLKRDVEALDDPAYERLEPMIDAVLAVIGAVRHHSLLQIGDRSSELGEHRVLDRDRALSTPVEAVTPWGDFELGGTPLPRYEPAWAEAREAARHARAVAGSQGGEAAAAAERTWQAEQLRAVLESS